ncbi:T9SS type A sorting domain-containing protein [Limibacter armeniacum]|uniref:T9SS type A sorting domain-containing protein n=1 Tax=Limibacter armeniacum TaxID=466084 RepID=UPI002FE5D124
MRRSYNYLQFVIGCLCCLISGQLQAATPDWSVNAADYNYSMGITGRVLLNGNTQTPNDMIGVFVNGECRGVAKPIYIAALDQYQYFLLAYSNQLTGETLSFQYYQAEGDQVISLTNSLTFTLDDQEGTVSDPYILANAPLVKWQESSLSFTMVADSLYTIDALLDNFADIQLDYELETFPEWLVLEDSSTTIEANEQKNIAINIKEGTKPGSYQTELVVHSIGGSDTLQVQLTVEEPISVLTWEESTISLEMQEGEAFTFEATILNHSDEQQDYELVDLPVWLTTTEDTGSVPANGNKTIAFEAHEGINVGQFEQAIRLTTTSGVDEVLNVQLRVLKSEPEWGEETIPEGYTMNLIGQMTINGEVSSDPYDKVGVFAGEELRGTANLTYDSSAAAYLVLLEISNDTGTEEELHFKVWDASTGRLHEEVTPSITFKASITLGTTTEPIAIVTTDEITLDYDFPAGWTWVSFNLNAESNANINDLLVGIGSEGDVIKGQDDYDQYSEVTGWIGSLTNNGGVTADQMYKIKLTNASNLQVKGTPVEVNSTDIAVDTGWNYVGFTPQVSMTITEALAGITPMEDDLLKSQDAFSLYHPTYGWVGTLQTLRPGEGYMLYTGNETTFTYPETSTLSNGRQAKVNPEITAPWSYQSQQFKDNMSMVIQLEGEDISMDENWVIAAFVGNECRGIVSGQQVEEGQYFFMTVGGESEKEVVRFKAYNAASDRTYILNSEVMKFTADKLLGNLSEPVQMRLVGATLPDQAVKAYPNPFESTIQLLVDTEAEGAVSIKLVNITGSVFYQEEMQADASGQAIWSNETLGNQLPPGTYLLMVTTQQKTEVLKMIKKK